jgi:hypothetical protein
MARLHRLSVIALVAWFAIVAAPAADFKLANGNTIRGDVASADEDGLVVKLDIGGFSKREAWINFSQETLKELSKDQKMTQFVEPFIELEPEQIKEKEKQKEIIVKEVPNRLEREPGKIGLLAALLTPMGIALLAVVLLTSVYAGYEIAMYRQQPPALVCVVCAIAPILGPVLFLCLPRPEMHGHAEAAPPPPEPTSPLGGGKPATAGAGGGLSLAAAAAKAGGSGQALPQVFSRGDTTFNRRFFETKFPGFFRVVPGEAEKDLVLDIKVVRGEYVAKRITRISSNEMHVQVLNGGEVLVQFAEMTTVTLRHKDAKS